jgi:DNA modification methylase
MSEIDLRHADCSEEIKNLADNSIDSCITDPPYALVSITKRFGKANSAEAQFGKDGAYKRASRGFMGKQWDTGDVAFAPEFWAEVLRVLKPGAHLVAFGGTRTYHRLACAIEDAGFEIRDQIGWLYGSGFPKSHDVSKGIDKALGFQRSKVIIPSSEVRNPKVTGAGRDGMEGATRPWIEEALKNGYHEAVSDEAVSDEAVSWQGWGTALKPAWEPIVLARKPIKGTVATNVLAHGTGAINIGACRIESEKLTGWAGAGGNTWNESNMGLGKDGEARPVDGRFPANIIHDGSDEVLAAFPDTGGQSGAINGDEPSSKTSNVYGAFGSRSTSSPRLDSGSAARFFYSAKADAGDRLESKHPTVKPVDLMAYLCRLITPPGGTVLDPFAGSGSTGMACMREGFNALLIEREAEYVADIRRRIDHVSGQDAPLFASLLGD